MFQASALVAKLSIITLVASSSSVQERIPSLWTVLAERHSAASGFLVVDSVNSGHHREAESATHGSFNIGNVQKPLFLEQTSIALQLSRADRKLQDLEKNSYGARLKPFWPVFIVTMSVFVCIALVASIVMAFAQVNKSEESTREDYWFAQMPSRSIHKANNDRFATPVPQAVSAGSYRGGSVRQIKNLTDAMIVPPNNRFRAMLPRAELSPTPQDSVLLVTSRPESGSHSMCKVAISETRGAPAISLMDLQGSKLGYISTEGLYNAGGANILKVMTAYGSDFGTLKRLAPGGNRGYALTQGTQDVLFITGDFSNGNMAINIFYNAGGNIAARVSAAPRDMLNLDVEPESDAGLMILIVLGVLKMEVVKLGQV